MYFAIHAVLLHVFLPVVRWSARVVGVSGPTGRVVFFGFFCICIFPNQPSLQFMVIAAAFFTRSCKSNYLYGPYRNFFFNCSCNIFSIRSLILLASASAFCIGPDRKFFFLCFCILHFLKSAGSAIYGNCSCNFFYPQKCKFYTDHTGISLHLKVQFFSFFDL